MFDITLSLQRKYTSPSLEVSTSLTNWQCGLLMLLVYNRKFCEKKVLPIWDNRLLTATSTGFGSKQRTSKKFGFPNFGGGGQIAGDGRSATPETEKLQNFFNHVHRTVRKALREGELKVPPGITIMDREERNEFLVRVGAQSHGTIPPSSLLGHHFH